MTTHTIAVSRQVYELVNQRARQVRMSPDSFAESVLREYLNREDALWREKLDALLTQVHGRATQFSSEEIEADVSAAAEEARESRCARRSAS